MIEDHISQNKSMEIPDYPDLITLPLFPVPIEVGMFMEGPPNLFFGSVAF